MAGWRETLRSGVVIPAHPLALTAERKLDERRQRALTRYYLAAGAGGVAVGVHTTQFEIRDPRYGLLEPVLSLAMEELRRADCVKISGVVGARAQGSHPIRRQRETRERPRIDEPARRGRRARRRGLAGSPRICGHREELDLTEQK